MDKSVKNIVKLMEALLGKQPKSASNIPSEESYPEYLASTSPSQEELDAQAGTEADGLPTFAIAMVGEGQEQALRRTAASLRLQTYSRWKLVSSPEREPFDYIMYMWPGDTLAPHALYEFAHAARGHDLIYCDDDLWTRDGRQNPHFKPELNPFTQLSYDMLGSGVAVGRELFKAAGPMAGDTGSGRYGYNLRCMEKCVNSLHIPKVLYTCQESREPGPEARISVEKALKGEQMALPGQWKGSFRVEARVKRQSAALIIRSRDRHEPLMALLGSIDRAYRDERFSIVIADQGSTDQRTLSYYDILERNGAARVFYGGDVSAPKLLNEAAKEADRDAAIFMQSGVEVLSVNWIESLLAQALRPKAGAAGPKIIGADGRLLHTGTVIGIGGWQGSAYAGAEDSSRTPRRKRLVDSVRGVSALSAVCMALPMDAFFNVGCFDESFEEVGFDTELCLRLTRRGYGCIYAPNVTVRYTRPMPNIAQAGESDKQRCYDSMREVLLAGDPNYSPNFDYSFPIPRASVPPRPAILLNDMYAGR